jgi:hypothetical protein
MNVEEMFNDMQSRLARVRDLQRQVECARQALVMASNECLAALEAFRAAIHRASEVQASTEFNSETNGPNDHSDMRSSGTDHAPDSQNGTRAAEG